MEEVIYLGKQASSLSENMPSKVRAEDEGK